MGQCQLHKTCTRAQNRARPGRGASRAPLSRPPARRAPNAALNCRLSYRSSLRSCAPGRSLHAIAEG